MDHRPVPGICIHWCHLHVRLSGHGRFGMRQPLRTGLTESPLRRHRPGRPRRTPRHDGQSATDFEGPPVHIAQPSGCVCADDTSATSQAESRVHQTTWRFAAYIPPEIQTHR